jgi:hypothetical protein
MRDVTVERELAASPATVWALLRDFGNVAWMPPAGRVDVEGDGAGMRRHIHGGGDGPPVVERLVRIDEADRTIEYTIDENNPLPVSEYLGTVAVSETTDGAAIRWSAVFEPVGDPDEATAVIELMLGALVGWLADGALAAS